VKLSRCTVPPWWGFALHERGAKFTRSKKSGKGETGSPFISLKENLKTVLESLGLDFERGLKRVKKEYGRSVREPGELQLTLKGLKQAKEKKPGMNNPYWWGTQTSTDPVALASREGVESGRPHVGTNLQKYKMKGRNSNHVITLKRTRFQRPRTRVLLGSDGPSYSSLK